MGLQKYRADQSKEQSDGSRLWFARWLGGPSLSKIENCRIESLHGDMRATVYIQGEPDTYFSQPAKCYLFGQVVKGYITSADDDSHCTVFHHCYY